MSEAYFKIAVRRIEINQWLKQVTELQKLLNHPKLRTNDMKSLYEQVAKTSWTTLESRSWGEKDKTKKGEIGKEVEKNRFMSKNIFLMVQNIGKKYHFLDFPFASQIPRSKIAKK